MLYRFNRMCRNMSNPNSIDGTVGPHLVLIGCLVVFQTRFHISITHLLPIPIPSKNHWLMFPGMGNHYGCSDMVQ